MLSDYQDRDEYDPPTIRPRNGYYWCHTCKAWKDTARVVDEYTCLACGETILCHECGQPWEDTHAHDALINYDA